MIIFDIVSTGEKMKLHEKGAILPLSRGLSCVLRCAERLKIG